MEPESLTPPLSSSDEGRSPASPSRVLKRPRITNEEYITLHEESIELERTEHHFPSLQAFIEKLDGACQARWATRHIPYKRVIALLVSWEDDNLSVRTEIRSLAEVL